MAYGVEHIKKNQETEGMSKSTEERGDLLIRNIWKRQADCILDMPITNLDATSNIHRQPEAVLLSHEREKKKYIQACLDYRRHFSPVVVLCSGNEAKVRSTTQPYRKPHQEIRNVLFRNVVQPS